MELGNDLFFVRIPESGKLLLGESGIQQIFAVESRIQLKEPGIPLTIRIRNQIPLLDQKIWNLVPGIRNPRRGIQNPRLHGRIPLHEAKLYSGFSPGLNMNLGLRCVGVCMKIKKHLSCKFLRLILNIAPGLKLAM